MVFTVVQYAAFSNKCARKITRLLFLPPLKGLVVTGLFLSVLVAIVVLGPLSADRTGPQGFHQQGKPVKRNTELIAKEHRQWLNLPGSSLEKNGLRIRPVPFKIVEQNGSGGQPNLPVNLYGAHLQVKGDFAVHVSLTELKGKAIFSLYGRVPLIFDEFRYERDALQLTLEGTRLSVHTWKDHHPGFARKFTVDGSPHKKLSIVRQHGVLIFVINGKKVGEIPENSLFDNGTVWFGAAAENADWLLASLQIEPRRGGQLEIIDTSAMRLPSSQLSSDSSSLQRLAAKRRNDFTVGAAVALAPLIADQEYARTALGGSFGSLTTENALKWQFVHPEPTTFDFREADALVNIARRHNIQVHGHPLVFGEANPAWVRQLPIKTTEDKHKIEQIMTGHISSVVGRYKGKIASWDVVNEPLAGYDQFSVGERKLRGHLWYQAMGKEYVAAAFRAARAADPQAKLFINEYGLEEDGERWEAFYRLVKELKEQGVPIDGVGFQAHVFKRGDRISAAVLREHIQALASIGVIARISEMDVYMEDGPAVQAKQYSQILQVCLEEPNCVSFTTWGVSNRYNMFRDGDGSVQYGQDFLWDWDMQPTPAVQAMRDVLK